jgi:hypothetical protein
MAWNLNCLGRKLGCMYKLVGGLATVTFRRLDEQGSGEVHQIYRERRASEKTYHTWVVEAVVDENPRANRKGAMGAEVSHDIDFFLYCRTANDGSRKGETYTPEHKDFADFRGVTYEVTGIEHILPAGEDQQLGFRVKARRYR